MLRFAGVVLSMVVAGWLMGVDLPDVKGAETSQRTGLSAEEAKEAFVDLLAASNLDEVWQGATKGYSVVDDAKEGRKLVCRKEGGGNLLTKKQYADFVFRFEFKLTPGANNGVGIRTPAQGNPAYVGMEIQILDDAHEKYRGWLKDYQTHGSIYGVVPAKRGFLKPTGQWNSEEICAKGRRVKVTLNGTVIVDADLDEAVAKNSGKTLDGQDHPGLKREKGHIGFLGHGDELEFRNVRIKELR
jgi:hypothetical protein